MSISPLYQGGPPAPPPPIRQQSPIQLKTTRDANGAMTTETPVSGYGGDDFGIAIAEILRNRMQQPQAPPPQQYAPPPPPQETGARMMELPPPSYRPELGSAPVEQKQKIVSREAYYPDNPYQELQTGHKPMKKMERGFVGPNGQIQWEWDSLRPKGGSGGIEGGGMGTGSLAAPRNAPEDEIMPSMRDSKMTPQERLERGSPLVASRPQADYTGMSPLRNGRR